MERESVNNRITWKWNWSNDWLFVASIFAGAGITTWLLFSPNPNPTNARYILSTIPETIGTVFVITVAVMQMMGNLDLKQFVKRPEFIVTSIITAFNILLSLVILYLNKFCHWTAICIGTSTINLGLIGWFIVRVIQAQDIQKHTPPETKTDRYLAEIANLIREKSSVDSQTSPISVETESIVELKKEATDALNNNVPSAAIEIIRKLTQIAVKEITEPVCNEKKVSDICSIIANLIKSGQPPITSLTESAVQALFAIDTEARKLKKYEFSINNSLVWLNVIGANVSKKNPEDEILIRIKEYTLKIFDREIKTKRVNTKNLLSKQKPDLLDVVLLLVDHIEHEPTSQEIMNYVIDKIAGLTKNPNHTITTIFAYIIRLIAAGSNTPMMYNKHCFDELVETIKKFSVQVNKSALVLIQETRNELIHIWSHHYPPFKALNSKYRYSKGRGNIIDILRELTRLFNLQT